MKSNATYQKLRGGYYTPKPIADFLAQWAIQNPDTSVLEPSCGDGMLLEAAIEALESRGASRSMAISAIQGVELDPWEAERAALRITRTFNNGSKPHIHIGDFFSYCNEHLTDIHLFDAVIGNPPFIRYQNFPEEHRIIAFHLMQNAGLHPNRLTNSWVPFLVATTLLLKKNGRMAMVIPAELLQVNYAAELRAFLSQHYSHITLITFRKLVFEGIQQEVVLLLGERNGSQHTGIRTVELEGIGDLASYEHEVFSKTDLKEMDHSTEKWTMYFLEEAELKLLRRLRTEQGLTRAGNVLEVDVGIVTGQNGFFLLTKRQVEELSLQKYVLPIVGRSAQLAGSILSNTDWSSLADRQLPAFLLNAPNVPFDSLPDEVKNYVISGERRQMHTGFKCRNRKLWYIVPSFWVPDAFMLRQVHAYPKIILNDTDATCTDTIHRIRFRVEPLNRTNVAVAFLNSLTFAFAEVTGRSYGGGVLELEPNEAERLPLPLKGAETINMYEIDKLLREGNIYRVLDITDKALLRQGLGLSIKETRLLRGIWEKLRDRRINRKPDRSARHSMPLPLGSHSS